MAFTTVNSEFWVERLVARGYRQKDSLEVIGATGDFFTSHGEKPMFMRTPLFRILAHRLGTPERNFSSIITPVELAIGVSEYVEPIRWFNYVSRLLETSPFLLPDGVARVNHTVYPYRIGQLLVERQTGVARLQDPEPRLLAPGEKIPIDKYFERYHDRDGDYYNAPYRPEDIVDRELGA